MTGPMTDGDDARIAAIDRVIDAAIDGTKAMKGMGLCQVHGPIALVAMSYLIIARAGGMSDSETVARLLKMATETKAADPAAKVH